MRYDEFLECWENGYLSELRKGGFAAIRKYTGLTQIEFGRTYRIPRRSIENWESGGRACPPYTLAMIAFAVINN